MQAATYIALSSQMALTRQMDVVANNLANASTPAFKAEHVLFAEYLDRNGSASESFVQDFGSVRDTSQGAITPTGNSLDIALQGAGYLKIDTPLGGRYTRNGRLQLDANGQLVTSQGYAVLGSGDQPITVPSDAKTITITRDGTISTDQGGAGQIEVLKFDDERALRPASAGLYVTEAQPTPASDAIILQGMVEESNVQPIIEMTRLMKISQNYSSAKDLMDGENSRAINAIDKLGKVA
ncbi:MAG: flagellar basal-body rod protein FlgF [Alphaproteobacteria bacterium]|nr:flagellar basal-body rod protein FlgF [Alphaproteobacteria bacterium]